MHFLQNKYSHRVLNSWLLRDNPEVTYDWAKLKDTLNNNEY